MVEARLPEPFISFTPSRIEFGNGILDWFTLFGPGEKRADHNGHTFLYDLDQRVVHSQVHLHAPKPYSPFSLTVGDALYVMDKKPLPGRRFGFEALTYGERDDAAGAWRLRPPPYVLALGYDPDPFDPTCICIRSYAVVAGSKIWISTPGIGTYSFDTARASWTKAGSWELPFSGRADYFPELGSWLGFSSHGNMLSSSDLSAASELIGPALRQKWEDLHAEEGWILIKSHLVHLGSGRFCVAKFLQTEYNDPSEHGYV